MIRPFILFNLKIHGNLPDGVHEHPFVQWVIMMALIGDGILTENLIRKWKARSGVGSGPECLVAEQITGEEFPCALDQKISKEKVLMDLGMTGRLVMKM